MSVEKVNLLLGLGELFFKRRNDASGKYLPVGTLKGNVNFAYEMTTVEQKPGNRLTVARRDKTAEKATLTAQVCDFKMGQLIAALGLSVSTTQLTATTTLRVYEDNFVLGSTTTTKTLGLSAVSVTSIVVQTLDRSTKYTKGTHFSCPDANGIKPLTTTTANKSVFVHYDTAQASATVMKVGDKFTLQEVDLKYTTKLSNGKYITIEIPIATIMNGLTLPFGETDYTVYDISFAAIGDTTKTAGESLFKIVRQA